MSELVRYWLDCGDGIPALMPSKHGGYFKVADVEARDKELVNAIEMIEAMSMLTSDPLASLDDIRDRTKTILATLRQP